MPASVILYPVAANPHPNSQALPLGGEFLQWSPFYLIDYTLEMYGGAGAVEVTGLSALVNSSFIMDGPNANLINDGTMGLVNSQLTINGSLAGTGAVIATQGSTITAGSSVPSQIPYPLSDVKPDPTVTATSTYPSQFVVLESSTLNITGGVTPPAYGAPTTFFTAPVVMDKASTVNLEGLYSVGPGKNFRVYAIGGGAAGLGTLNIEDGPVSISGFMSVDANVALTTPGDHFNHIEIDGGRLALAGACSGGNIIIGSGMLEFAPSPAFMHSPETASENFHSTLNFGLSDAAIKFDGISGALSLNVNLSLDDISVFNHGQQIANFHLGPAPTSYYSAADFSVRGNELLYHHSAD